MYWKIYKIEGNDESKETKCTQIVICENFNQAKKKHCLDFLNKHWIFCSRSKIEKNPIVQYDYNNFLLKPKYL